MLFMLCGWSGCGKSYLARCVSGLFAGSKVLSASDTVMSMGGPEQARKHWEKYANKLKQQCEDTPVVLLEGIRDVRVISKLQVDLEGLVVFIDCPASVRAANMALRGVSCKDYQAKTAIEKTLDLDRIQGGADVTIVNDMTDLPVKKLGTYIQARMRPK